MRRLALVLLASASTMAAQTPSAPKDAGVATVLGFLIPGGGQYYAEATGKGLAYTALTVSAVLTGNHLSHDARYRLTLNERTFRFDSSLAEPADRTPLVIGAAIGGAVWLLGAITAPDDARRANAKRARVTVVSDPKRLGLAVAF